jgi:hypothetical protein
MKNPKEKPYKTPALNPKKKLYKTPTLTSHGSVENITQSSLIVGTGDAWAINNLDQDVLGDS